MKVFIYPPNSLILSDLVERFGHEPLVLMSEVRKKVTTPHIDSPPMNMTPDDPKKGLKYAAIEIPSGVRGRMSLLDPLIEQAEAAIIVHDAEYLFGCMGCARTNELLKYVVRKKGIPVLEMQYPKGENEAKNFVLYVKEFLDGLGARPAPAEAAAPGETTVQREAAAPGETTVQREAAAPRKTAAQREAAAPGETTVQREAGK